MNQQRTFLTQTDRGTIIRLIVQPRTGGKSGFSDVFDDRLKLRINAAPVDGQANRETARFIAKLFGRTQSQVVLLHGAKSRRKDILIEGMHPCQVLKILDASYFKTPDTL